MCTRAWPHSAPTASACPRNTAARNLDYLTLALVLEEIAAGDGGTSTAISVTNCPVNAILMRYGNEAQKKQWLTRWRRARCSAPSA
jgi:butyryl-CoA dehydrogenase